MYKRSYTQEKVKFVALYWGGLTEEKNKFDTKEKLRKNK